MKRKLMFLSIAMVAVAMNTFGSQIAVQSSTGSHIATQADKARIVMPLNNGWTFTADNGEVSTVDLPHDFLIGQPWIAPDADDHGDASNQAANVKSRLSSRAFKEMGQGVYELTLTPDKALHGKRLLLDFGGIMLVGDVYLNGERIGGTDYGYLGFEIDVTKLLKLGEENQLKVVASTGDANNSRWYTGGGLYRGVKLVATSPDIYFQRHPLKITTNVGDKAAQVHIEADIAVKARTENLVIRTTISDLQGTKIISKLDTLAVNPKWRSREYTLPSIDIANPQLWDTENPNLYKLRLSILDPNGQEKDVAESRFGIRTIEYSPLFGFKLNGKKVLMKGIANHHTLGALGAANYPRAIEKRLQLLKEYGFNHVRTSHNPYSEEYLDLCDEYGFIVVDELYDKWLTQYSGGRKPWEELWIHDLPEWVKRDRNHPCVVMWSLGNELQGFADLPFNDWGVTTYRMMKPVLQRYDQERPVTVAMHPRYRSLETDSVPAPLVFETDIAAYNYRYMYFPGDHRQWPDMIFYQSEANLSGMGPNFFEPNNDQVIGLAYWGMIDYLGESLGWPAKGWPNGVFDISLQPKSQAWLLRSMFKPDEPVVHIGVMAPKERIEWNDVDMGSEVAMDLWNFKPGDSLKIYTYTNASEVALLINGVEYGRKRNPIDNPKSRNRILWEKVPYQAGNIEAVGYDDAGNAICQHRLKTVGKPVRLLLEADNADWKADGLDLQHIVVRAVDKDGNTVPMANDMLDITLDGNARIVAVDNGDITSAELHTPLSPTHAQRSLHQGTALVILRSTSTSGTSTLTVSTPSLPAATIQLSSRLPTDWYPVVRENRPGVRWWWLGSAVDSVSLTWNLEEMAAKGLGTVEITPIYGVKGNEANDIDFLSEKWMQMYGHTRAEGDRLGIRVDINNGTGWPFGGPTITTEHSAQKRVMKKLAVASGQSVEQKMLPDDNKQRDVAKLQRVIAVQGDRRLDITNKVGADSVLRWKAPKGGDWTVYGLFCGRTLQQVKRAAPGGAGLVVNHYDSLCVKHYLDRFDEAFAASGQPWPESVFNDSYEVYQSDWTDAMLDEFERDHGYKLEMYLPELGNETGCDSDLCSRVVRDYRYTLGRLLRDNFTRTWTQWAHSHGATVRNQAHGSPANIIDLYAEVDIPECESFGQTDFDLPALAKNGATRPSDADPAVLKFASSAAHLIGAKYTSAETLTWLTQHFCTSLARCKPEIDQMLCSGVNRMLFHGAPYSPKDAPFPGWMFYASIDFSPKGGMWRDADKLFNYVADCQAFLSAGTPDNDFLLYFPIEDLWSSQLENPYFMFEIHRMDQKMPQVKASVREIINAGYDCDYVSDDLLTSLSVDADGQISAMGGARYKAFVMPHVNYLSAATLQCVLDLASNGATVVFCDTESIDVPGLGHLDQRRQDLAPLSAQLPKPQASPTRHQFGKGCIITAPDITSALALTAAKPERLKEHDGIQMIRRCNECGGYNYFVSLLGSEAIDGYVPLSVSAGSVVIFDPLRGASGLAQIRNASDGTTELRLQLEPGQSVMLKTFPTSQTMTNWAYIESKGQPIVIDRGWKLAFENSDPEITETFDIDALMPWTSLPIEAAQVNFGTGIYSVDFNIDDTAADWLLDLGDVRESAEVWINGQCAGKACFVPFTLRVGELVKPGTNHMEVRVTNLQANRIADYERRGVEWRIFKDANIASVDGAKEFSFAQWPTFPSGLNSPSITLTPIQ